MKYILALLFLFCTLTTKAQKPDVLIIDSLPPQGILLNKGWKWHAGDNPDWRKPSFDDSQWEDIDPTSFVPNLKKLQTKQPLWLRIKLETSLKTAALSIKQSGATEIFLNGRRIKSYGKIDPRGSHTLAFTPIGEYLLLNLDSSISKSMSKNYILPIRLCGLALKKC